MQILKMRRPGLALHILVAVLAALLAGGGASARNRGYWRKSHLVISGAPATNDLVGQTYIFTPTASDSQGSTLTFSVTGKPSWATFNATSGELSGVPTASNEGTFANIVITATDGVSTASLAPFSITVSPPPNTVPTISGQPPSAAMVGMLYSFSPTATDTDGDALSFTVMNLPVWATFSATTGTISGTPSSTNVGTYSDIVISVSDGVSQASLPAFSVSVPSPTTAGGATVVFSYPTGFAGATDAIQTAASAQFSGSAIALSSPAYGTHQAGAVWYKTPQNIQSFTTDFTFQLDPTAYGITFCIQNTNSTTNPLAFGDHASADANMLGYGAYNLANQWPLLNSIAIKFDLTAANGQAYLGTAPSSTGVYINGGPYGETGFVPEDDLTPSGINLHSGDTMDAHIVYDGTILTLTLRDMRTNAQTRMSWPVDIPSVVGSNYAWVGFTGGTIPAVSQNLLTWTYWQGYNQQLPAPTFNETAGEYSSPQTITIAGPVGATLYYTTNGQAPTTSSLQYTSPITVGASTVIKAVAVQNGYTDSAIASAYYQIASSGISAFNFPNGFSGASNVIAVTGASKITGSDIQLTDTTQYLETGGAWFVVPVNVQKFTTTFTIALAGPPQANGFTFTIQNHTPTSSDTNTRVVGGGPETVSSSMSGLGYQGIENSVAVIFDLYDGSGDLTGLYTNGAAPSGASVDMSSSGLSLHSGNPLAVTIDYSGATLSMTIVDTKTGASFSKSWPIDIPAVVGGNTAYVGFTGSTGGQTALQEISSWTYSNN